MPPPPWWLEPVHQSLMSISWAPHVTVEVASSRSTSTLTSRWSFSQKKGSTRQSSSNLQQQQQQKHDSVSDNDNDIDNDTDTDTAAETQVGYVLLRGLWGREGAEAVSSMTPA